ncbi:MAG: hypothetical protein QXM22_03200 [Candidatus Bathyarchaeia archaeon]
MPLQEFEKWFEKETANLVKPLDNEASKLIDDVRKRMNQIKEDCENLIKECEREIEKGKAYHRARVTRRLATFFIDTLNKINFPQQVSLETTETFVKDLKKVFSVIGRERNIWFPRISPLFIIARRKIDVSLGRLFDLIEKLDVFTKEKYSKVKSVADGFATAHNIAQLQSELEKLERETNETQTAISSITKETQEKQQRILAIEQREEMRELLRTNSQAHELNRKAKYELRYVQKPFVKMLNLYHSGDVAIPTEEHQKLVEYLRRPFLALAKEDDGYPLLKKILQRTSENMGNNKIKLKTSRQKKAQDQIESILKKDALLQLQLQCKQVYQRRKQLLTSGTIANLQNEAATLKATLKEQERMLNHLNSKQSALENNKKEKKDKLETHRKELEKTVHEVTKKTVRLKV